MRNTVVFVLLLLLSWGCSDDPAEPPEVVTPDDTPPAAVGDLAATGTTAQSVTLAWTAPGDDGANGAASQYDIRYSTSMLNASLWATATRVKSGPSPGAAGSTDTYTATNLEPDTDYYFALKTADERANWSALSNVVAVHTHAGTLLWQEVALDLTAGDSRLVAVDFTGSHGMAMGLVLPGGGTSSVVHDFWVRQPAGGWVKVDLGTIRSGFIAFDLAVDILGGTVLAGYQAPGPPSVILDLRDTQPTYIEQDSFGMLTVDGEGLFMVAGGRSDGGGLWSSDGPGNWNFDDLPLSGSNDSGFRDVYIRGERAVACGYDDGADTLQVILTRTSTAEWEKTPLAGTFGKTYDCIALDEDGTIFVGGIEGAGGLSPRAFLSQRTPAGDWADLILPDAATLHGVADILLADDGSVYLACWGEGDQTEANIIHADPSGVAKEITPFPGGLIQIDQAEDGSIYAVGFRRDQSTGAEQGVMLVKNPGN